jgi:beta-lactamase class A
MTTLEAQVEDAQRGFEGRVSLYAKNLRTGADYEQGADTRVQTASTIKVAILAGAYAAVAAGQADWEDALTLTGDCKAAGAGVLLEMNDVLRLTLRAAAHLMIVVSDNTATNLVLDRIGADTVNDCLDGLGLKDIRCLRRIGGGGESRAAALPENAGFGIGAATPRSFVQLLEALEAGQAVSAEASAEILAVMQRQQQRLGIGRRPKSGVSYANKPGALDRLRSDIGLISSAGGPIALAITCDQLPETDWSVDNPASLLIARLSEILTSSLV